MKKALIWVAVLCFLLMIVSVIFSIAEGRKKANSHKLATVSSFEEVSDIDSQKSYGVYFPVR